MAYISTRGEAPKLSFTEALLAGLAPDGGLYVPEAMPHLAAETLRGFAGKPYVDVAQAVISPFLDDDSPADEFKPMLEAAYASFRHKAVTPLAQIDDNLFVLELFHGPTLAFKDVAMQLLGRLMDRGAEKRAASARPSSARRRATPAPPRSRLFAAWIRSMSSFFIRTAASRTCSAAR